MSVVFMTTAACAWRANAGATGLASTDIARRAASGMWLVLAEVPAAAVSRAAIWLKVRVSGPARSMMRPRSVSS